MDILKIYSLFQSKLEITNNFDLKYMALGLGGEVGEVLNEKKNNVRIR